MIDTKDFDPETWAKVEIMAEDMGVTVEDILQTIDEAKKKFYETNLS